MDIFNLKCFIEVAKIGNFSRAAENIFITQATISKKILSLEKELNVQLFDRKKKKTELTLNGKILLFYASKILSTYNEMQNQVELMTESKKQIVHIGATSMMLPYNILTYFSEFRKTFNNVNLYVDEIDEKELLDSLHNGKSEIIFSRNDEINHDLYDSIMLFKDKIVVCLSNNHHLSKYKKLSFSQIKDEKFMMMNKGTSIYNKCIETCNKYGFMPNVIHTANRMTNIFETLSYNDSIAFLLNQAGKFTASDMNYNDFKFIPLNEDIIINVCALKLKNKQQSLATEIFWQYIKDNIKNFSPNSL